MTGLNIPTDVSQLENRSLTDLARELPDTANPFLPESWVGAQAIANARRVFEFYKQLGILELEAIPITATELLPLWASFWGVVTLPATAATGVIVATGTPGSVISAASLLQSSSGQSYSVEDDVTVSGKTVNIASLTSVGLVATAVLASPQSLFSGMSVTIAGAVESPYNGAFPITVTGESSFTFVLPSSAASPATGTPSATWTSGVMSVASVDFGQNQNLSANEKVNFATPIVGVNSAAYVDFSTVGGGTDQESLEDLRRRLLIRVQNPVALFNAAAISSKAREVPGVTDVFVEEITPNVGQVTIYFTRGNDASPIPDPSEVVTVKNKILEIKPAHTADADVIVLAPTPVPANFVFTTLNPNSSTMQTAITNSLKALLLDEGVVSEPVTEDQYRAAIVQTIDPANGDRVVNFALSSPTGDLGGASGEYVVFNSAVFP